MSLQNEAGYFLTITKCTITYKNGDTTTRTVTRPEDGKCSDLESEGKLSIGGIDIDVNTTVKCVTVSE